MTARGAGTGWGMTVWDMTVWDMTGGGMGSTYIRTRKLAIEFRYLC
jgi:hypothetical protein